MRTTSTEQRPFKVRATLPSNALSRAYSQIPAEFASCTCVPNAARACQSVSTSRRTSLNADKVAACVCVQGRVGAAPKSLAAYSPKYRGRAVNPFVAFFFGQARYGSPSCDPSSTANRCAHSIATPSKELTSLRWS